MEKYDYYNELLEFPLLMGKIALWFLIIIIGSLILCLKYKMKDMAIVTVTVFTALIIICCVFLIYPYQKDIEENAYTFYTGEFYVVRSYFSNGNRVEIKYPDRDKSVIYRVFCDDSFIYSETQYEGTLVYSTRSKCVVDIILP